MLQKIVLNYAIRLYYYKKIARIANEISTAGMPEWINGDLFEMLEREFFDIFGKLMKNNDYDGKIMCAMIPTEDVPQDSISFKYDGQPIFIADEDFHHFMDLIRIYFES